MKYDLAPSSSYVPASIAVAAYGIWRLIVRPYLEAKHPVDGLPTPPRCHWLFGHLHVFSKNLDEMMQNLSFRYADVSGRACYWLGPSVRAVSVTKPEDVRAVLHSEYMHKLNPLFRKHTLRMFGRKNIISLSGRLWKYERSNIMKSFTPTTLGYSKDAMTKVAGTFVESMKQKLAGHKSMAFDVEKLMKLITLDVFGIAAFSHPFRSCEALKLSSVAEAFDYVGHDISRRLRPGGLTLANFFYCIPTKENIANGKAVATVRMFVMDAIEARRKNIATDLVNKHKDLVTTFLDAHSSAKGTALSEECTDEVLVDVLVSLLFAGYDTTSVTLSYALYMLGMHHQYYLNCIEEIDRVGVDNVDDLVFVRAAIKEVLRLFPPAFMTTRFLQKKIELDDGFVIPKDVNVLICIWAIQRDQANFPEPMTFRPDRWARRVGAGWVERTKDKEPSVSCATEDGVIPAGNDDAFFPFSAGARSCPGQKFALQEATTVLACLLRELQFTPITGYSLEPERNGIVQHAKGGIPMEISLRK